MMRSLPADTSEGRLYGGPEHYIQRSGEIYRLDRYVRALGSRPFVVVDRVVWGLIGEELKRSLAQFEVDYFEFAGECNEGRVGDIAKLAERHRTGVIVGIGGGKTLDSAKLLADRLCIPVIIAPSAASSDAPCSGVAVVYTEDGVYKTSIRLKVHPAVVLVDSDLIMRAPLRLFVAGIGDALSTWFEARSNQESGMGNYIPPHLAPTRAGLAIARACHDVLMEFGIEAKEDVAAGKLSAAVEHVIEANTLLSGVGFENCGASGAHGIHDGLTVLPQTHHLLHGEKVGFGVLCLLLLEERASTTEFDDVLKFCRTIGLPTRLRDLGLEGAADQELLKAAEAALLPESAMHRVARRLTSAAIVEAIKGVDARAALL